MKLTNLYNDILNEGLEPNTIGIGYLRGILKNTTNKTAQKYLNSWISKGTDIIKLSPKQYAMLKVIEKGGPSSKFYDSKN